MNFVRRGKSSDVVTHFLDQLLAKLLTSVFAGVEGYEGVDCLALNLVRKADDRSLGDLRVRHERAFHLRGADAVTGDVDDVVDAAGDPVIAILVAAAAVAGKVEAGVGLEIGLEETAV